MPEICEVIKIQQENPMVFSIKLKAPKIAAEAKPGQFVMIKPGDSFDPLLRRPLSIMEYDKEAGEITLLLKIVGIGTAMLYSLKENAKISLIGPLGNGFDTQIDAQTVHLIAGGTGVTPLYSLAAELRKQGKEVIIMLGTDTQSGIIHAEEFGALGCNVRIATMDGSFGCPGTVCLLMQREAEKGNVKYICACGPNGLMKQIDAYAEAKGIPGQICLDAKMACGVGACKVCTCELKGADGKRVSVCKDGPVFKIGEVEIDG